MLRAVLKNGLSLPGIRAAPYLAFERAFFSGGRAVVDCISVDAAAKLVCEVSNDSTGPRLFYCSNSPRTVSTGQRACCNT